MSRHITRRALLAFGGTLAVARLGGAQAKEPPRAVIRGGTVLRPGQPDATADVTIEGGDIVSVGSGAAGGEVIDAKGKVVTAGLTDPLTSTGLVEISLEKSSRDASQATKDPVRAAFRAADGYNPASTVIGVTRLGGVTSVGVVPRGGLVSGQSAWADLDGATAADAIATESMALHASVELPTDAGQGRGTALLRLRELFDDAAAFKRNPGNFQRRQLKEQATSRLDLVAVARALDGKIPVVFHADRASDILAALRFAKETKLRPIIASAAEGWKVASEIATAKAPVIVDPLAHGPASFSTRYAKEENAALLHKAGVSVCLTTHETHNARKLRQVAGNAVRAGLPRAAALAAVTRNPAQAFGLGDRYGTLEKGRVANVVVWSGDPFELSTRVEAIFIRGRRVPLRSRQTALFERYR